MKRDYHQKPFDTAGVGIIATLSIYTSNQDFHSYIYLRKISTWIKTIEIKEVRWVKLRRVTLATQFFFKNHLRKIGRSAC